MPVTFANIAGFWALLGIPAVLLIHFLQRQSRELPVSTLFLLDQLQRESVRGRKFDRLKNSLPLWLQLISVLFLTWLLVQPRWLRSDSVQRISIVLDSSASMRAFQSEMVSELEKLLASLGGSASRIEYKVLESHLEGQTLYQGSSPPDLIGRIKRWKPFRTAHDPGPALRVGRSLAGPKGLLIFVTDHADPELPYDARLLSVGEPIPNVGFAGMEVTTDPPGTVVWRAMVRNYASTSQSRDWFLTAGKQRTATRSLALQPGETRSLQGKFPGQAKAVTLRMQPDRFDQDDILPVVIPQPKELRIGTERAANLNDSFQHILSSLKNVKRPDSSNPPDLVFSSYNPLDPSGQQDVAIVFLNQKDVSRHFLKGPIVSGNHPLISGLNWQGLIARNSPGIPMEEGDQGLLWQGDRSLIFVREQEGKLQLFFNFDVTSSNAEGLPAYIVLIHRFAEMVRDRKVASETRNFELHQAIVLARHNGESADDLAVVSGGNSRTIPLSRGNLLKAPDEPAFFTVAQGKETLLRGAAHFADTREADFSGASSSSSLPGIEAAVLQQQTEPDRWWQLWVLVLLLCSLLTWYLIHRPLPESEVLPTPM